MRGCSIVVLNFYFIGIDDDTTDKGLEHVQAIFVVFFFIQQQTLEKELDGDFINFLPE